MSSPRDAASPVLAARPSSSGSSPDPRMRVHAQRSVALVGPTGVGKTSLAEALLARSGAIVSPGLVERGNTVSDHDPLARRWQHSLASSVLHLSHDGAEIHLLDTPGLPDFLGQALPALQAVDTAVVVVNASTGVEPGTRQWMAEAARLGLDRVVVVNRIDAPGVDLARVLAELQAAFGRECLPLNLPAHARSAVVDCFNQRDGVSDFGSVADAHRALVEQVVEVDGDFVERYLNDGDVPVSELHAPLELALRQGHLVPVCFASARQGQGLDLLLDALAHLVPDPTEGNPPLYLRGTGDTCQAVEVQADPDRHVLAQVFKLVHDAYVGRLAVMRVHQGRVQRDTPLWVGEGRRPIRIGHLYRLHGKALFEIDEAGPGELCAFPKAEGVAIGAVLHDDPQDGDLHLAPVGLPEPVHGLALSAARPGDDQRLWEVLHRCVDEDPCLRLVRQSQGRETVVYGLGELQLRALVERLRELHHLEVRTQPPKVAYRETITRPAAAQYRHKKQSGGAGQFGEVHLRVQPLARGDGVCIHNEVKGGAIPSAFMPAVEKGIQEALAEGVLSGHPVVDVAVTVVDGKHHSVDSKEVAFVAAARQATLLALLEAQPVVLEPIAALEVRAPEAFTGDITGDLAARRGQVTATDALPDGWMSIRALVPWAELTQYQTRLSGLTAGQGRHSLQLAHHEIAPPHLQRSLATAMRSVT